ncbi:kinetochore protein Mis12/MTW1, partial [Tremellales sp. Uapishka_1]
MPPARKSLSKSTRRPAAGPSVPKVPPPSVPDSITPDYVAVPRPRKELDEEQRNRLVQEVLGFVPGKLLFDISEATRIETQAVIERVAMWAAQKASQLGPEAEREVDIGLHQLETLVNSQVDKAFDMFTAWSLRNIFDVPTSLEIVLPWHKGLDFSRGAYVAALPKGEETLMDSLESLRSKVEQTRLLAQKLELAETQLDKRLEIAKQRKAEVGFVKQIIENSGVSPLPTHAVQISQTLSTLHATLQPMQLDPPATTLTPLPIAGAGDRVKAWELGRQAYLNWAVGKVASATGTSTGKDLLSGDGDEVDIAGIEVLNRVVTSGR